MYCYSPIQKLGPSINGLVTDGNTKLCCRGFILALFQSTTANKIDTDYTRDYKRLIPVCEAEILRVIVKRIEVFSSFYVNSTCPYKLTVQPFFFFLSSLFIILFNHFIRLSNFNYFIRNMLFDVLMICFVI